MHEDEVEWTRANRLVRDVVLRDGAGPARPVGRDVIGSEVRRRDSWLRAEAKIGLSTAASSVAAFRIQRP